MKRERLAFLLAIVVLTGAFSLLALGQAAGDRRDAADRRVTLLARAVALVTRQRELRDDAADLPQPVVEKLGALATRVVVLKGNKILADSDPAKAGTTLDPESLADKALFDAGSRLKALVGKNVDEKERRPELVGNPYPELELGTDGERVIASVPAKLGPKYLATARVEATPAPLFPGFPTLVLLYALGAMAIFVGVTFALKGKAAAALGGVLLIGVATLDLYALSGWRAAVRTDEASARAQTLLALAPLVIPELAASEKSALVDELDQTANGVRMNELVAVRSSTVGAAPIPDGIVHTAAPYEVVYAQPFYRGATAVDLEGLRLWALGLVIVALGLFGLGYFGQLARAWKSFVAHRSAYGYMAPAMVGMAVLVFIPVVFGIVLGFLDRRYNVFEFAGLSNFIAILSDFSFADGKSFYFKFAVTVLWTVSNVTLHVSIGLFMALMLNDPMLKAKGLFRVLLVVPWAIPNYITALIWKGMFHKQFGAVNFFLEGIGMQPVAWFQDFWPAFFTNLATNTWLGFPFMMVVSLGALQSIPADLYEAAFVDGASRWQRFSKITLPLLKPALVPAVILGTVWTFNMFNIIYLVSGGAPNGATDILITDAYRWAFERDKYGYAAAYSTLIFLILLTFTLITNRVTGATKGAYE